jgi:hemoglobin
VSTPVEVSLFSELGGESRLRAIVDDFVDRVFADTMIGFFFAGADRARIKLMEYELAAGHLGADVKYTGKPLPQVHRKHPIMGGHFMRRLQILRETLHDHNAPERVIEQWITANEKMRAGITNQPGSHCDDQTRDDQTRDEQNAPAPPAAEPRRLPLAFAAMATNEAAAPPAAPQRRLLPLVGASSSLPSGNKQKP